MQVRAGRQTGAAKIGNRLPLFYFLANTELFVIAIKGCIDRGVLAAMLQDYDLAVATFLAFEHNLAVAGCAYRRATFGGIVYALV